MGVCGVSQASGIHCKASEVETCLVSLRQSKRTRTLQAVGRKGPMVGEDPVSDRRTELHRTSAVTWVTGVPGSGVYNLVWLLC